MNETLGDPSLPRGTVTAFCIENDQALAALVNLIVVLADNDYFLGMRISDWAVGAPQLEMGVACAAIAQDKLGHSRALYPLLEDLPWPGAPAPLQRERDRERHYSVSYLDAPFPAWANVAAALALIGPALGTYYIVDAFMVVILGGMGQLAGTVGGGVLVGTSNSFLDKIIGSTQMAKFAVLLAVIAFIQLRPSGIFSTKERSYD